MSVEVASLFGFNSSTALLLFVTCSLAILHHYITKHLDFWRKRNVPGPKPLAIFGNYKDNILGRIHATELIKRYYDEYKDEKMVGIFVTNSPVLILRDLELIKDVLSRDFSVFSDRGIRVYESVEPLSQHFFNLPESSWHPLRKKLSPNFTILKIKQRFVSIVGIADRFMLYLDHVSRASDELECTGLMAKFMTEVIGDYGFELQMDEFSEGLSEFRRIIKKRMESNYVNFLRRFLREYCPCVYRFCYFFYNKKMIDYFVGMIGRVVEYRESKRIRRNDYVGSLIDLKNNSHEIQLTESMIAAQAYVFYTAGADTTAMMISNALYEISANRHVQDKLRHEINEKLKNQEELTFNNMKDMEYLNLVFKETLRKYALRNITRKTNKPYTLSGTNVTIPKNTQIIIPQFAIQRDHRFYPQPEVFDPERFADCQDKNKDMSSYLPFGNGPRKCVGELLAHVVSKIVIVKIVQNFELEAGAAGNERGENDPRRVFLYPKNGIRLRLKKIANN